MLPKLMHWRYCSRALTQWCHMVANIWFNIGNGLLPDGTKPLPEPVLTYGIIWGHYHNKIWILKISISKTSLKIAFLKSHADNIQSDQWLKPYVHIWQMFSPSNTNMTFPVHSLANFIRESFPSGYCPMVIQGHKVSPRIGHCFPSW